MAAPTKGPRLGGGASHERLMLRNMATSLFKHGKITTTETNEEAVALASVMPVAIIRPGTIRNPPLIPKKPAALPPPSPNGAMRAIRFGVMWTSGSPSLFGRRSIDRPIAAIAKAKARSSQSPDT